MTVYHARVKRVGGFVWSFVIAIATAIAIVALAVAVFTNPIWLVSAQDRAQATAQSGYTIQELGQLDREILGDMFLGSGTFQAQLRGETVFNERERAHLQDVRAVMFGFGAAAIVSLVLLFVSHRLRPNRAAFWAGVRAGAGALGGAVLGAGIFVVAAFPVAFELFHRLLFPGGTYTFDPSTERLVQVFPQGLWSETALAAGFVIIVLSSIVYQSAGRRSRAAAAATSAPPSGGVETAAAAGSPG